MYRLSPAVGIGNWKFSAAEFQSDILAGNLSNWLEFGWKLVSVREDHHTFKHPASRFLVTIVHPQKDVPVGRAVDTVKKIRLETK